jgi:DNA-damage-inducible protein D
LKTIKSAVITTSIMKLGIPRFKQWLAKVGYERLQDMSDPARSLDRAREYWQQHGRSEKWIQQRMMGQETRNKLTDYWQDHEMAA